MDAVAVVHRHTSRLCAPPGRQEPSIAGELLNPVVLRIRNIDLIPAVDGDAKRVGELAVAGAGSSPREEERPVSGKFDDAVVAGVTDVDIAVRIDCHPTRTLKTGWSRVSEAELVGVRLRICILSSGLQAAELAVYQE